jgi:uncharacterized protein YndB with AHSA1/START domain
MVVNDNSNQMVVNEEAVDMAISDRPFLIDRSSETESQKNPSTTQVRRQIDVEASPEEVFQALTTEEGRESWLDDEPERQIHVESIEQPTRLTWWWASDQEPATRVEFELIELPSGTRIVVTESAPSFPLPALAARFELVLA